MTEITNPLPDDPGGASTQAQESTLVNGSQELLDGASTGTDEGPAGVPAALVGRDKAGDEVDPPPAARPAQDGAGDATGNAPGTGPGSEADPLSPSDTADPLQVSAGRGDSADATGGASSGGAPVGPESVRGGSAG